MAARREGEEQEQELAWNSPSFVPGPDLNRSEAAKPISKIIGCYDVSLTTQSREFVNI